jgi:hypothetical protein
LAGSSAVYEELLSQRGGHYALLPEAALGLAQNALLQAPPEDRTGAIESLREVAARFPGHAAAAIALLTEAEVLLTSKQEEEAIRVFRNLLADYPGSIPAQVASSQLQRLAPAVLPENAEETPTADSVQEPGPAATDSASTAEETIDPAIQNPEPATDAAATGTDQETPQDVAVPAAPETPETSAAPEAPGGEAPPEAPAE